MRLLLGIGNPDRTDDGVGPHVVQAATDLPDDVKTLVLDGEPARIVEAWRGAELAVVVDAVRTGARPGTLHRVSSQRLVEELPSAVSSHGTGLREAVALGRLLQRLPEHLLVIGVEAGDVSHGFELTSPVAAAVPMAVEMARNEFRGSAE